MGYSKETERQNEALKDALAGKDHVKNYVQVGYEGKQKPKGDVIPKMTELMKDARMPLFCKKCDKVMKKKLDNKMWNLYNHCFDCQIAFEHKLKLEGKFDDWANNKIKKNKIAYIKDTLQQLEEFKTMKAPEWLNNVGVNHPELEKEKWEGGTDKIVSEAVEAIKNLTEQLEQLENE
tara:strand:+ start:350 stop:880 length:531 start_codon:yes stop_codon:yes gene_type:complete